MKIFYIWKVKFVKGLYYLGKTGLLLTRLALNCDSFGIVSFYFKKIKYYPSLLCICHLVGFCFTWL